MKQYLVWASKGNEKWGANEADSLAEVDELNRFYLAQGVPKDEITVYVKLGNADFAKNSE